jgi:hypothetical protein
MQHPPPVGFMGQERPNGFSERPGKMGGHRIDRDQQIHVREIGGRIEDPGRMLCRIVDGVSQQEVFQLLALRASLKAVETAASGVLKHRA